MEGGESNYEELPSTSSSPDSVVSVLLLQSQALVSCDICQGSCRRAVSLPCCQSQACRACAVKSITTYRRCWGCGVKATTVELRIELDLREAVKLVDKGMELEELVKIDLKQRWEARKILEEKRKDNGSITWSRNGVGSTSGKCPVDISGDDKIPTEQEDIQDQRWKSLRETRTDRERALFAKKMFNNAVESDPNRNLSYHGYRSRVGDRKMFRNQLQESSFEINFGTLEPILGFKRSKENSEDKNGITDGWMMKEKIKIKDIPEVMKDVFIKQLQERYGERYMEEDFYELKRFVQHYVKGFKETSDFFSFYNLGDTEKQVSKGRLEEMVDVEKLLAKFSRHYGNVEKIFCKECSVEHRF